MPHVIKCDLCNRYEDERNIQEQGGYTLCSLCDCLYTDEELIEKIEEKNSV